MNILAYVKHEMSRDGYIWQVFSVPNSVSNIPDYLASRGYSTKKHRQHDEPKQRKQRTNRQPTISGGQHLADVWRRSVIIPASCA